MSKQRKDNDYRIYYGVDSNAALEPEYVPSRREQNMEAEAARRHKIDKARARKAEIKRCVFIAFVAVSIALAGGYVLSRNAEIYKNVQTIRSLAKEKQTIQTKINDIEMEMSENCELAAFYDMAENELNLREAEDDEIITVVCAQSGEAAAETEDDSVNLFDSTVELFSSLERRIKDWL